LTNQTIDSDPEEEEQEQEDGDVDVDVDVEVDDDIIDENEQLHNEEEICENKLIFGEIQDVEEETEEKTEEEAEEKELKSVVVVACEKMKGSDVRTEKYERIRRCKENGENEKKELLNWGETHWMVTTIS
jgi:hypothetical protein